MTYKLKKKKFALILGFESKLTGILSTSYASANEDPEHPRYTLSNL